MQKDTSDIFGLKSGSGSESATLQRYIVNWSLFERICSFRKGMKPVEKYACGVILVLIVGILFLQVYFNSEIMI